VERFPELSLFFKAYSLLDSEMIGTVVGLELLGNWGEFGLLIAIAVMGAFIIYFNDKK